MVRKIAHQQKKRNKPRITKDTKSRDWMGYFIAALIGSVVTLAITGITNFYISSKPPSIEFRVQYNLPMESTLRIDYKNYDSKLKDFNISYKLESTNKWEMAQTVNVIDKDESNFFEIQGIINKTCLETPPNLNASFWFDNETSICYFEFPPNITICSSSSLIVNISGKYDTPLNSDAAYSAMYKCNYPRAIFNLQNYTLEPWIYYNAFIVSADNQQSVTIPFAIGIMPPSTKNCSHYLNKPDKTLIFYGEFPVKYTDFHPVIDYMPPSICERIT